MIQNPVVSAGGAEYTIQNTSSVYFAQNSAKAGEIVESGIGASRDILVTSGDGIIIPWTTKAGRARVPEYVYYFVMPASNVTIENA